jgi:hypothetical protein
MIEIEKDATVLDTDWNDHPATLIGHQADGGQRIKVADADIIAERGSHVVVFNANHVLLAESVAEPNAHGELFDYGFVKKNYNRATEGSSVPRESQQF